VILTNGIDIIDIRRIQKTIDRFGNRFKKKCFSQNEIFRSEKITKSTESYAKRYAAKEACAKALGTGLARGVFWKDIEIYNDKYGKPKIRLHKNALKIYNKINNNSEFSIEVSLSDEVNYAIANVIIYENKKSK
jgi:holo-[acyl-carrier protein] synthase